MFTAIRAAALVAAFALGLASCSTTPEPGVRDKFLIGVWGPASTPEGDDIRDGALLAAEEINEAGGIAGLDLDVEIIFCDSIDGGSPSVAVACVTKFIRDDQVNAIVGGASSQETLGVLDEVIDGETLFIATGAPSPDVTAGVTGGNERRFIFRIGPVNSNFLALDLCRTMLRLSAQTGFTRFGLLFEQGDFAPPIESFLSRCLVSPAETTADAISQKKGVKVVMSLSHPADAVDFSGLFDAFEEKRAKVVVQINARQAGVAIVRQWGEDKPNFALAGINLASSSDAFFEQTSGNAAFELNGPAMAARAPITGHTVPFFDSFRERFGRNPVATGLATYDAIGALVEAVERARSEVTDDIITQLEMTDRVGVAGIERFGPDHDALYAPATPDGRGLSLVYTQWLEDGERVLVFPERLAKDATYRVPPWVQ